MVITALLVSLSSTDMTLLYATMHSNGLTFCNFTIDWETLAAFSEYLNLNGTILPIYIFSIFSTLYFTEKTKLFVLIFRVCFQGSHLLNLFNWEVLHCFWTVSIFWRQTKATKVVYATWKSTTRLTIWTRQTLVGIFSVELI